MSGYWTNSSIQAKAVKVAITIVITLFSITYPLLVYYSASHFGPAFFGIVFLVIGGLKAILSKDHFDQKTALLTLLLAGYCALLITTNSSVLLKFYPVVVSLGVAILFAVSLSNETSLIEDFAIRMGKTITLNAKRYTRRLTLIWALILVLNAAIALYLSLFASMASWALYCGLISYLAMGGFAAGELVFRQYYIRRYGE